VTPVGIRATGVAVGENTLPAEAFAPMIGATPDAVARWNGKQVIRTSRRSAMELGAEAAHQCLERAGVAVADVDAIVWCTGSIQPVGQRGELRVQQLLGATNAFAVEVGTTCSELVSALWMAQGMIASGSVNRVLVVSGDQFADDARTLGLSPEIYQPVFSDVGAAALLEPSERLQLIGFGAATDGKYWSVFEKPELIGAAVAKSDNAPTLMQAFIDQIPINRTALARCLEHAACTLDDIDHVLLSREGPDIIERVARHMRIPLAKVVVAESGPTHSGTCDTILALEQLLASGRATPGQRILLGTRTVAMMRFAVLRI
jgi:3-oxoacyl-[acyl-carrier-protein] synthase-3